MRGVLLLFLLVVTLPLALSLPSDYSSLTIDGSLANPVLILADGRDPTVSSFTANISWFPRDREGQDVVFFTTIPEAEREGDTLVFHERHLDLGHHSFDVEYRVLTTVESVTVGEKVPFPITRLSSDLVPYVQPTETIDMNEDIRSLGAALAEGEDDLFVLVTKVASWTKHNVEYNLSTVNVQASQPSSYVLEQRQGVCDEITNLFISLLRSLGVPARFVSGVAYTSSDLYEEEWGAHGWAEVYFPGIGWVPFDVTYGQYGWTDASHVVFAQGVDSGKYASGYSWLAHDVEVEIPGMALAASVVDEGPLLDPVLVLSAHPLEEDVGIGSYQLVMAEVSNPSDHYVADVVRLARVDGLELLDPEERSVVLPPGGETWLSWRVLVDEGLSERYLYTYPIVVAGSRGASARDEFYVKADARSLSASWVQRFAQGVSSDSSPFDDAFSFSCSSAGPSVPRVGERVSFRCSLRNEGETSLRGVRVCVAGGGCEEADVPAGASASVVLERSFPEPSLYALSFTAEHSLAGGRAFVPVEVVAPPVVRILNLSSPESLGFFEEGLVSFSVVQEGGVPVSDVTVSLRGPRLSDSWSLGSLVGEKRFRVSVAGNALSLDDDRFVVSVAYRDERGELVVLEESFSIAVGELSWWQRAVLWLSSLLN